MNIEFTFNSTTHLTLTPTSAREKQLIALFREGAQSLKIRPSGRDSLDSLIIEICPSKDHNCSDHCHQCANPEEEE